MWTLVVVIYVGLNTLTAATSTTVTGFKSKALCEQAAKEITEQLTRGDVHLHTVCLSIGSVKATAVPLPLVPADPAKVNP